MYCDYPGLDISKSGSKRWLTWTFQRSLKTQTSYNLVVKKPPMPVVKPDLSLPHLHGVLISSPRSGSAAVPLCGFRLITAEQWNESFSSDSTSKHYRVGKEDSDLPPPTQPPPPLFLTSNRNRCNHRRYHQRHDLQAIRSNNLMSLCHWASGFIQPPESEGLVWAAKT